MDVSKGCLLCYILQLKNYAVRGISSEKKKYDLAETDELNVCLYAKLHRRMRVYMQEQTTQQTPQSEKTSGAKQMTKDMTKGEPLRLLLWYSLPLLLGNIFQQLYSMVDTIIVGKVLGEEALAAVGTTGPLNFLVLGFAMGVTSGFAVSVAQRFGAGDEAGLKKSVSSAIVLTVIFTIVLTTLSVLGTRTMLRMINTPDDIFEQAYQYIVVIFGGIATMMLYNILACILRALGDSKTPLYFLIISSVLNILLDLLFIITFDMGVAGAAWATVISQGCSGILCFFYMKIKFPILKLSKADFKVELYRYRKHLAIGLPMAFQFSITAVGTVILQRALNLFGTTKIAAYTAASKVEQLVTQPAGTFGVTMANYSGQNLGADRVDRIKEGVTKCTILTLCFAVLASLVLILFGEPLTSLFLDGDQPEVMEASLLYLRICAVFFPFLNMIFVYRNMLQGIGRSLMPLMAGVFELIARSVVAFTLPDKIGYTGICLAGPFAWIAAAVPLGIAYVIVIRRMMSDWKQRTANLEKS